MHYTYSCMRMYAAGLTVVGFLYMDRYLHQHITATQYVAPLMANFHTRPNSNATGVYFSINCEFTSFDCL